MTALGERLPFEEFRDYLGEQLEVDLAGREAGARLADDLELDSVQRLEALVAVEGLGVYLEEDTVGPEQTLGGLHELYVAAPDAAPDAGAGSAPEPTAEPG